MLYQLVLITNLGVITPLAVFPTQSECIQESAYIKTTNQYSVACLPTNSPEEIRNQIKESMKTLNSIVQEFAKEQK